MDLMNSLTLAIYFFGFVSIKVLKKKKGQSDYI